MKTAILALALFLTAIPASAATCYPPAVPVCSSSRCSSAEQAQYEALVSIYNDCQAENVLADANATCQRELDTRGGNGTATFMGEGGTEYKGSELGCRVRCDDGHYLTKGGACLAKDIPEPVPTPEPVVTPAPEPEPALVPAVEIKKPGIIEAARSIQLFTPKKAPVVSQEKPAEEAVGEPTPEPGAEASAPKKPWWHWFNPFNWF